MLIDRNPIIHSNNYTFNIFSEEKITPLLMNYFVNVYFDKISKTFNFTKNKWMLIDEATEYYYSVIPKKVIFTANNINYMIMQKMITNNFFLITKINKNKSQEDNDRNILVYDFNNGYFNILEYNKEKNNYYDYTLSYNDLKLAILDRKRDEIDYHFIHIKEDFNPIFDLTICKESLKNYLMSKDDHLGIYNNKSTFGINAIQSFCDYIKNIENNEYLKEELFLFFLEHKQLMYKRINYLNNLLYVNENLIYDYRTIINISEEIVNQCQIFNVSNKTSILDNIISEIHSIENKEKKIISSLLLLFDKSS